MRKLTILLDYDDVLAPCAEPACKLLGIDYARVTDWNLDKTDLTQDDKAAFYRLMENPEFYRRQLPYEGAVDMVNELISLGHDVIIASAVKPAALTLRADMISEFFPMIPPENIMLGARKDLLKGDILLDDNPYNLAKSTAEFRVLFRRGHSGSLEGSNVMVNSYDGFLEFVQEVTDEQFRW